MQLVSPLVQVMTQPISVISILHIPIIPMLQQQHIIPFIIMQQLIIPPCIIMHRFFIISADVLSSHMQVIFIPPLMRSILMVQRGAIIMLFIIMGDIIAPIIEDMPPIMGMFIIEFIAPGIIPLIRSVIMLFIVFIMAGSFYLLCSGFGGSSTASTSITIRLRNRLSQSFLHLCPADRAHKC